MKCMIITVAALMAVVSSGGNLTQRIAQTHKVKAADTWYGGQRTVFDFDGYDAWLMASPVCLFI